MRQMNIKTFTILTFLLFLSGIRSSYAQLDSSTVNGGDGKYLIKLNLLALPLNNFSFQAERAVGKRTAVGLGLRFMPKSGLPFKSQIENLIDDPESWKQIKDFKTGNFAITPEVRFYMGKGVFRGFYVAPFVRYTRYTAELPFTFNVPNSTDGFTSEVIPLSGNLSTITGGVLLGAQWKLTKLLYLDWSIFGPQYGASNGSISGNRSLSTNEQNALRDELQTLSDLPLVKTTYTVDQNGATVDFKGPWAGIRSSFSLGFRF
ncbi:MAG: DUF3575 domain-containing protein [Flavobacterium sp.]|nr:DUF3575 domain-containing protein [Pedobacter sp.]